MVFRSKKSGLGKQVILRVFLMMSQVILFFKQRMLITESE